MTKKEDGSTGENPKPITRREFTKGSMAVIGAYTALPQWNDLPPLTESAKKLKLDISEDVQKVLDERGIIEEDLRRVIDHAENSGMKLYQPGTERFLSKLRINQAMFYVEYVREKDTFRVDTAYLHRFKLGEE